jgi:hypothetical protein
MPNTRMPHRLRLVEDTRREALRIALHLHRLTAELDKACHAGASRWGGDGPIEAIGLLQQPFQRRALGRGDDLLGQGDGLGGERGIWCARRSTKGRSSEGGSARSSQP